VEEAAALLPSLPVSFGSHLSPALFCWNKKCPKKVVSDLQCRIFARRNMIRKKKETKT